MFPEDISQPRRKMEWKTSVSSKEDGEEDISHGGRWRGRHQPRRKMERKTSTTKEDGEEDISQLEGRWRENISHGGRWRGRHQPRRKTERKRAATTRRSEDCPSGPAPFSTVQTKNTRRSRHCVEVIFNAGLALCKQRSTCTRRGIVWTL